MWTRAKELAASTPETRNRYVDFLRAASITVVVFGHWLVAAPHVNEGELQFGDMLHLAPWTQWLTWALQVMPIFFIVGGFSNGISWESARKKGHRYGVWITARLRRLVAPLVPLIVTWSVLAAIGHQLGVVPRHMRFGSQAAFIPTWFLAVYVMVAITAPVTHWFWRKVGLASFWMFALAAATVDTIAFTTGLSGIRWVNYGFIWLGVHHLGYLWRDGRVAGVGRAIVWAAFGLGTLIFLVTIAGYPVSMIGVPGEDVSNSRPPTFALFALGMLQFGLVLAVERPLRRWLSRLRPWAVTILVNGTIMTLYLWHLTAMVLVIALAHLLGDVGLGLLPGTSIWWASRPVWLAIYSAGLAVAIVIFGRFEQTTRKGEADALPPWQAIVGAVGVCAGLAMLALGGIGAAGNLGVRVGVVALVLVGVALILGPPFARTPR